MKYQLQVSFEQRSLEAKRLLSKYPDRVPVICEKNERTKLQDINKKKFLVPHDLTVGQFTYVIRKNLMLSYEFPLHLLCNGKPLASSKYMREVQAESMDPDGSLYLTYLSESVWEVWWNQTVKYIFG